MYDTPFRVRERQRDRSEMAANIIKHFTLDFKGEFYILIIGGKKLAVTVERCVCEKRYAHGVQNCMSL